MLFISSRAAASPSLIPLVLDLSGESLVDLILNEECLVHGAVEDEHREIQDVPHAEEGDQEPKRDEANQEKLFEALLQNIAIPGKAYGAARSETIFII